MLECHVTTDLPIPAFRVIRLSYGTSNQPSHKDVIVNPVCGRSKVVVALFGSVNGIPFLVERAQPSCTSPVTTFGIVTTHQLTS